MIKILVMFLFLAASLLASDFPVTIVDDVGISAVIPKIPKRIISLAPSNTEILFMLGLGDRVVGVSSICNYPAEAGKKEKVGDFFAPSLEKILLLKPDLVIAGGGVQKELALKLSAMGIPTMTLYPKDLKEMLLDVLLTGKAAGKEAEAVKLMNSLKARIEKVKEQAKKSKHPKVYFEIWNQPVTSAGKGSFIDELITIAGGENIFSSINKTFPEVSAEEIIKRNPDIIITAYMEKKGKMKKEITGRAGWTGIKAVKDDKVFDDLDPDLLLRSGPRLVDGLEELEKKITPKNKSK
ncbi:MAG: cobalamin-binding protein [Candidatus Firestonebacteria bacterium]|nr:cobalamin-binding protein [Candidatus Firestonebacteria bacterium]